MAAAELIPYQEKSNQPQCFMSSGTYTYVDYTVFIAYTDYTITLLTYMSIALCPHMFGFGSFLLKECCDRGMGRWFTDSLLEACKIQNTKRTHKKIIERGGCPGEIDGALRLSRTPLPLTQTGVNIEQASIQTPLKIL